MSTPRGKAVLATGMADGDVWDDRELIRDYDRSVRGWRRPRAEATEGETTPGPGPWTEVKDMANGSKQLAVQVGRPPLSLNMLEVGSWIVGAPCRALYSEDGLEYEAKIMGIEGPQCTVRFVVEFELAYRFLGGFWGPLDIPRPNAGPRPETRDPQGKSKNIPYTKKRGYGNEETIHLQELKTTHGKKIRDKQRREAQIFNQSVNGGGMGVDVDCQSNISLTSSMYNNYTDSVCRDRDLEETLTEPTARTPLSTSTPLSGPGPSKSQQRGRIQPIQFLGGNYKLKTSDFINGQPEEPAESNVDDSALPSAAEATIDSSSELSSGGGADGPQEVLNDGPNGEWENFNNTMPPMKFPVPPMPLSLANNDGSVDFGRGELPALLMSWYMAGYQSGFFDAKREMSTSANNGNSSRGSKSTKRMN